MLAVIFAARRKNHRWDLEALETATRAARRQRDHRPALLPTERKLRGLLGSPLHGRLISRLHVAHPVKGAVPKPSGFQNPTFRKAVGDRSFGCFE